MTNRSLKGQNNNSWRKKDLRDGYTTSACAAACAAAGIQALKSGKSQKNVVIDLPGEKGVTFEICRCEFREAGVLCGTIKDSGDDPDITNGAEIQTLVRWQEESKITICGGLGVGLVTKPGLAVEVGEPAINPGPRRLIEGVVNSAAEEQLKKFGVSIEIRVPQGVALAKKTLNPRLGIVGGISILGNSGVLKPFSHSAYRASIYTELKAARANGIKRVVLTTGSRSEKYAMAVIPGLPEQAFIQVGDHMGFSLRQCGRLGINAVIISGMIGKISKLAQGRMQTHVSEGLVDFEFLAGLAAGLGADEVLLEMITQARTAAHVKNLLENANITGLEKKLAIMAARECFISAENLQNLELLLFQINGDLREWVMFGRFE